MATPAEEFLELSAADEFLRSQSAEPAPKDETAGATPYHTLWNRFKGTMAGGMREIGQGGEDILRGSDTGEGKLAAKGASRILRGTATVASPVLIPAAGAALAAAPLPFVLSAGAGIAAQQGVERGAKAIGVDEGYAELLGDLAGLPGYVKAGKNLLPKKAAAIAQPAVAKVAPKPSAGTPAEEFLAAQKPAPPRLNRAQRRASVMPPETGVSDQAATDLRARTAQTAAGKPLSQLDEAEREIVEQLARESEVGVGARATAEMERLPSPPRRNQPGASSRRIQGQRGSFSAKPISPKPKPIEEEFLNFKRIAVSPQEEQALRTRMQGMAARGTLAKDIEPHAAILQAAKEIDPALLEHVSRQGEQQGLTGRAAIFAMREQQLGTNKAIVGLQREIASKAGSLTDDELKVLEDELARIETDDKRYLTAIAGIRTDFGRNLASLKMMARGDDVLVDLPFWLSRAKRALGLTQKQDVPDDVLRQIRGLVADSQAALEKADANAIEAARSKLAKYMAGLQTDGWLETVNAVRKAGLLTSPVTHGRNIGGNTAFQAMEEVARIPASLVDAAWALKSGKRTVAGADPEAVGRALQEAATRGMSEARNILRTGATGVADIPRDHNFQGLRQLGEKSDSEAVRKAFGFSNDLVNGYVNVVFRTLSAEDRVFKVYAIRRATEAGARVQALNEKQAGKIADVAARAAELAANPSEQIVADAIAYGDFATFNNPNAIARGISSLGRTIDSGLKPGMPKLGSAAVDFVVPFKNTPANIFARVMDYSPAGPIFRIGAEALRKKSPEAASQMQRVASEALGRGSIGTALLALGWYLGKEGLATGTWQGERPEQKNVMRAAGRQPGAVQVAGDWQKVAPFAPGGALVTIGASFARAGQKGLKDEAKRPDQFAQVVGQTMLEQPMLKGLDDLIGGIKDTDKRGSQLAQNIAGSFVPTGLRDAGTLIDPRRVEFRPPKGDSGVLYGPMSKLPGVKSSLPEARDIFGRPLEARRGNAVNPLLPSTAKERADPMLQSLLRDEIGIAAPTQGTTEPNDEFRARSNLIGATLELTLRGAVREMPEDPDERKRTLRAAITEAKREVADFLKEDEAKAMDTGARAAFMNRLAEYIRARQ